MLTPQAGGNPSCPLIRTSTTPSTRPRECGQMPSRRYPIANHATATIRKPADVAITRMARCRPVASRQAPRTHHSANDPASRAHASRSEGWARAIAVSPTTISRTPHSASWAGATRCAEARREVDDRRDRGRHQRDREKRREEHSPLDHQQRERRQRRRQGGGGGGSKAITAGGDEGEPRDAGGPDEPADHEAHRVGDDHDFRPGGQCDEGCGGVPRGRVEARDSQHPGDVQRRGRARLQDVAQGVQVEHPVVGLRHVLRRADVEPEAKGGEHRADTDTDRDQPPRACPLLRWSRCRTQEHPDPPNREGDEAARRQRRTTATMGCRRGRTAARRRRGRPCRRQERRPAAPSRGASRRARRRDRAGASRRRRPGRRRTPRATPCAQPSTMAMAPSTLPS